MADVPSTSRAGRARRWLRRNRRDDRGATMVEAAFVTPVFVLVLFGVIEFSGYVGAATGANAAVKAGARMATVQGNNGLADMHILRRMEREGAGMVASNDVIQEIKIWHASSRDEDPPETCNASTECNHYQDPNQPGGAYELAGLKTTLEDSDGSGPAPMDTNHADCYFGWGTGITDAGGCSDAGTRLDGGWPAPHRRILEKNPNTSGCPSPPQPSQPSQCDTTDLVGIWIKVRHDYYTGFFGQSVTVTSKTVAKIEPQGYDG